MKKLTTLIGVFFGLLPTAHANDFPTIDRVEYVLACMRDNPGPRHEMLYKCACSIDSIAGDFSYEQYVEASTAANAMSIGGERGGVLRDSEGAKELAGKYRGAVAKAKKACFIK